MAWRGPPYAAHGTWLMLRLLWKYLTDSAASPLQKAFVECEAPLCAELAPAEDVFSSGYHQLWFEGAEVASMDEIPAALLKAVAEARDSLDMTRMAQTIARHRRQHLESLEDSPTAH